MASLRAASVGRRRGRHARLTYEFDDGKEPWDCHVGTLTGRVCGTAQDPCQMMEMLIDYENNAESSPWSVGVLGFEPVARIMLEEEARSTFKAWGGLGRVSCDGW